MRAGFASGAEQRQARVEAKQEHKQRSLEAKQTLALKPGDEVEYTGKGGLHGHVLRVIEQLPKNVSVLDPVTHRKYRIDPVALRRMQQQ